MHARVKGARRPLFESAARPIFFRPPLGAWAPPAARIRISFLFSSFDQEEFSGRFLDREKKCRLTLLLLPSKSSHSGTQAASGSGGPSCPPLPLSYLLGLKGEALALRRGAGGPRVRL